MGHIRIDSRCRILCFFYFFSTFLQNHGRPSDVPQASSSGTRPKSTKSKGHHGKTSNRSRQDQFSESEVGLIGAGMIYSELEGEIFLMSWFIIGSSDQFYIRAASSDKISSHREPDLIPPKKCESYAHSDNLLCWRLFLEVFFLLIFFCLLRHSLEQIT